jgi:5-methylcytosine-specific restriction endonuclease McrA
MNKRKRTSEIWTTPHDVLQDIINESNSVVTILKKLGFDPYTGNHRTLTQRLKEEIFDMEQFNINKKEERSKRISNAHFANRIENDEIFQENSKYTNNNEIKKRLLILGVEYKCVECGVCDTYNGREIKLQLDHINGINTDNRIENLRFLCPNCHSQTKTFSGKRHRKYYYCECGEKIYKLSKNCYKCKVDKSYKIDWPDLEHFKKILWEKPTVSIAKDLGVSDKAVENHIKKLGLTKPSRGYWQKKKSVQRGLNPHPNSGSV